MKASLWLLLVALTQLVSAASLQFLSPRPGAVLHGGDAIDIEWIYSDNSTFQPSGSFGYDVFLCAGGNADGTYEILASLAQQAVSASHVSISPQIEPDVGGMRPNAYFLEIIIDTPPAATSFFSSRFSLSNMTGSFSEKVKGGLDTVSSTDGPEARHDVHVQRRAGAPAQHTVPYQDQTGSIRYAPMAKTPPTKISVKTATRQHPTSSFDIATDFLSSPTVQTTLSAAGGSSVKPVENTATPIGDDEMKRFLNRWRD